jgi:trimeric autotransporter adhesin
VRSQTRIRLSRAVACGACLLGPALRPALPSAQSPAACAVAGTITSSRLPLPGVVVTLVDADGRTLDASSSAPDGTYALKPPSSSGPSTLKASLVAFAPISRDVKIEPGACGQRVDLTMTLASRTPQTGLPATAAGAPRAPIAARGVGGRGQAAAPGGRPQQFQSLELLADQAGLARSDEGSGNTTDASAQALLPPGFSLDTSAESVTSIGNTQATAGFFGPNGPGDFAGRFGDGFGGGDSPFSAAGGDQAGPGGRGGPGFGGPGGGRGGFGPGAGPFGGRGRGNQIRGSAFQSFDTSSLDTAPYALNGQGTTKPDYLQQRFGATLGGPLMIGKLINSPRTFFFLNYTGNHSRNPFDAYSTVPTLAERAGDLSALGRPVLDPTTGRPFAGNQIPGTRIDPAARALLNLIPAPNQDGDQQNFHSVTTTTSQLDDVNVRFVRTFGAVPQRGRGGGRGGLGGGRGGGRGGPGGAGASNLNLSIHYRHAENTASNPFPTLGGTSRTSAWDMPVSYSFTKAGMTHSLRFGFNRQHAETQNLYGGVLDVAGAAGLLGVSTDPFDWGAPNLSFSTFASVRDTNPSMRNDRTLSAGDTIVKTRGRHTVRFGGDYRNIHADSQTDTNARGSFVFTGLYSGVDFGDFLLGLPQQATVQYGPGREQFRSRSWDFFVQDDWRPTDKITVNAGLRYEYFSPISEANNRLVTLDAAPGFTAAAPVVGGGSGPFSGALPDTIVRPFRTGFAPRLGIAWRPKTGTVMRAGYGINYNASAYQTIAQQLAGQPPFAVTGTVLGSSPSLLLPLETALLAVQPGTTMNSYAVDPNYRLGRVQIWNVDLQRDLTRTIQLGVGYTGTKGSNLDILRAPNRGPSGLLIAGVAPFIWESSEGDSIMHSMTVRLRKRLTNGVALGGAYTLSRSIDDASSIGGAGGTVAQNDRDLAAERGLSSFDQRHRFSGDFTYELPFGANKPWLNSGMAAKTLGDWQVNGTVQLASGTPFTARVLGNIQDVARGTNGTLRANYNGAPIDLGDPSALLFFNTAAFSVPAPGTFGNAGRNTIIGPGTSVMNLGLMRNFNWGQTRGLSIQILASNLFNDVQFASIDTNVTSPTFGRVTAVRAMRRVQVVSRFRF